MVVWKSQSIHVRTRTWYFEELSWQNGLFDDLFRDGSAKSMLKLQMMFKQFGLFGIEFNPSPDVTLVWLKIVF